MVTGDDDLFQSYEDADLEAHGEEATDKGPLGTIHDDDFETGFEPAERIDKSENHARGTDYEATPGRVREGKEGELDLSRVDVNAGGRGGGQGSGADWEGNMSTRKGMTAVDGTGYVSDMPINAGYMTRSDDVDEELHREMRDSGLRLGINSLNTDGIAFVMAQSRWMANQKRYWSQSPEKRDAQYAARRENRANRDIVQIRQDSIQTKYREFYNVYVEDREKEDMAFWLYGDSDEKARLDGKDQRSARQRAITWRQKHDEKMMQSLVVKYAAFLECIKPDSIRARFKRKPHQKDLAGFVFATDMLACGVAMPGGFDAERLLEQFGDELELEMVTPRTDRERREFIIHGARDFYAKGNLFPPYVYSDLEETLEAVVAIMESAGIDLSEPEPVIDWSKV